MLRRSLLLLAAMLPGDAAPVDGDRLNTFGAAYNSYISRLRDGVIDLALWRATVRAWDRLR